MVEVTTVGLDTAKQVFQVECRDAAGNTVLRRQLRRGGVVKFFGGLAPCLIGMEACGAAHYWARELQALGHTVRLMPPTRVKAYVKPGKKNDQADAAACCEAVTRPGMSFVPIKTPAEQAALMLHRTRRLLIEQRTCLANALRSHLAEFGLIARRGDGGLKALQALVDDPGDTQIEPSVRPILQNLLTQWRAADAQIAEIDRQIAAWHEQDKASQRLDAIPQFGAIISSAFVATATNPTRFSRGRDCSAWIGLVPAQHSTGGKTCLGSITKAGDRYLRQLLVIAGTGILRRAKADPARFPWAAKLLERMPAKKAAIAVANKLARIAWAVLASGKPFDPARAAL